MKFSDLAVAEIATDPQTVVAAAALLCLWVIESVAPMYHAARDRAAHAARNLTLGGINALVAAGLLVAVTVLVVGYCRQAEFGLLRWVELPILGWIVALLALDATHYGAHVLFHKTPLLWRVHAVHHHDADVDVTTAARFHPVEIAAQTFAMLPVIALLGLSLPQIVVYETLLVASSMFHHSNVRMPRRVDSALRWLIVTPRMHWVHHSDWQPETDSNYGAVLSLWDRLFGTFRLRPDPASIRFGLEGFARRDTRTLRGMLLTPVLRRRARLGEPPTSGVDGEELDAPQARRRRRAKPASARTGA